MSVIRDSRLRLAGWLGAEMSSAAEALVASLREALESFGGVIGYSSFTLDGQRECDWYVHEETHVALCDRVEEFRASVEDALARFEEAQQSPSAGVVERSE